MRIEVEDPTREDLGRLIGEHLADMHATSPPESVHALGLAALATPEVTVWTARDDDGVLLGCGALKELDATTGEIKSMRTAGAARGRGVGTAILRRLITEADRRGYEALYLETGSQEFFAPARRLYARHGFTECAPFGDYALDPNSVYMVLPVQERSTVPLDTRPVP